MVGIAGEEKVLSLCPVLAPNPQERDQRCRHSLEMLAPITPAEEEIFGGRVEVQVTSFMALFAEEKICCYCLPENGLNL